MNNSLSIFARALASENLSFGFDAKAETASFDVKNRHLVLPVWNVSETVQTMLIAHEISHALWTPYQQSEDFLKAAEKEGYNAAILQRIANVVEDVRIEKLMKQKYPGTRRDFFLGYKEINDSDMFGFSKADFSKLGLVNRVNIHFKWGVPGFIDIPLSNDEKDIVQMIDGVETFEEVFKVAKILYNHPSIQDEIKKMEEKSTSGSQKGKGKPSNEMLDKIAKDVSDGIGKKDGDEWTAATVTIPVLDDYRKGVISTSVVLSKFEDHEACADGYSDPALDMTAYRTFVKDSDAFVRQLAAQFDRRKAADEIRRERPKQTGMLNLDRLHQYRTHDDLFISKLVKQDGKNHGIVFMLDMSGSMAHRLGDCFLQILQLVLFCEKVKIPFEVFGFTEVHPSAIIGYEEYQKEYADWERANRDPKGQFVCTTELTVGRKSPTAIMYGNTRLINLASSRDDAAKRERLLAYLYDVWVNEASHRRRPNIISLGGTPTVEAVALATHFMQDWVKMNNIQIPTFMLVTDGQPNGIYTHDQEKSALYYHHKNQGTITVMNEVLGTAERIDLAKHPYVNLANVGISGMLNSLRSTFNARIVGMFVDGNTISAGTYETFCMSNAERNTLNNRGFRNLADYINGAPRFAAIKEAYKEGAFLCHPDSAPGYDAFFVVRTPKVVKDKDAITESGTFTKIKNTFIKTMAQRSSSRVFLTRYIDIVAGQKIGKDMGDCYSKPGLVDVK